MENLFLKYFSLDFYDFYILVTLNPNVLAGLLFAHTCKRRLLRPAHIGELQLQFDLRDGQMSVEQEARSFYMRRSADCSFSLES